MSQYAARHNPSGLADEMTEKIRFGFVCYSALGFAVPERYFSKRYPAELGDGSTTDAGGYVVGGGEGGGSRGGGGVIARVGAVVGSDWACR